MIDIERTVKDIMEDRLAIDKLDAETMELVADYLGEAADNMLDGPHDEAARAMLKILDKIGDEAELRIVAMDSTEFDEEIDASIDRGNTYFEMAEFVVQ
jgi:hypothetical protein